MKLSKTLAEEIIWLAAEVVAFYIATRVNQLTGLSTALMTFIAGSWLFYNLSSYERIWNSIAMLQDPAKAFLLYSSAATVFFALKSYPFQKLVIVALAAGFIGSALGIFFQTYWNIGG
ncbi:hypothetical protein ACK3SF_02385 [Candidatus Nanosalina sp. VS9-1]|uniref:hypothetical protein n=1 Tax=Candidatus Nanosalina sp. VS9-1 TaxID=3388566 RepID=UPI0039E09070